MNSSQDRTAGMVASIIGGCITLGLIFVAARSDIDLGEFGITCIFGAAFVAIYSLYYAQNKPK